MMVFIKMLNFYLRKVEIDINGVGSQVLVYFMEYLISYVKKDRYIFDGRQQRMELKGSCRVYLNFFFSILLQVFQVWGKLRNFFVVVGLFLKMNGNYSSIVLQKWQSVGIIMVYIQNSDGYFLQRVGY